MSQPSSCEREGSLARRTGLAAMRRRADAERATYSVVEDCTEDPRRVFTAEALVEVLLRNGDAEWATD